MVVSGSGLHRLLVRVRNIYYLVIIMTSLDYERSCIVSAAGPCKTEGQNKLARCDAQIADAEKALVFLLHSRREIINNYDLNRKEPR